MKIVADTWMTCEFLDMFQVVRLSSYSVKAAAKSVKDTTSMANEKEFRNT